MAAFKTNAATATPDGTTALQTRQQTETRRPSVTYVIYL